MHQKNKYHKFIKINIKTYNNSKFVIEKKLHLFINKMKYSQKYEQKM